MKEFLARYVDAEAFDKLLSGYLRGVDIHDALKLPINNALLSVGKRLRPALCYLGSDLAGGDRRDADPFAAAIECIHCYSLVHDDLECMDNDAYRHGKPAIHAQFGEDIAVLCGDALLNLAFEILIGNAVTPERRRAAEIVARKAGVSGMIGGQAADVSGSARDLASLEEMYRKKTGALLAAALMSGAAVGGTDDLTLKRLEIYAYDIGVAYQFRDDVLDVTSTREELGKDIGSDSDEGKVTAVTLLGVDGANNKAKEYFEDALDAVAPLGERSKPLFELADLLGARTF